MVSRAVVVVLLIAALAVVAVIAFGQGDGPAPGQVARSPRDGVTADQENAAIAVEDGVPGAAGADPAMARERVETGVAAPVVGLSGRLLLPGGAAARGVGVRFREGRNPGRRRGDDPEGGGARGKTDAAGRFHLPVATGSRGFLELDDDDYVFAGESGARVAVPALERDRDMGDLALAAAAVLAGVVHDEFGKPVAGVQIGLSHPGGGVPLTAAFTQRQTTSGDDGGFSFGGLGAGDYTLHTASPMHLPADQTVSLASGDQRTGLVLTLRAGRSISGVVLDDLRHPVEGASVGAYRRRDVGDTTVEGLSVGESVKTDAQGHFRLGGVAEDQVTVRAWSKGFASTSQGNVSANRSDVVLVLRRAGAIEGVVVDTGGTPIAGSDVSVEADRDGLVRMRGDTGKTDAEGRFRIDDLMPGAVRVLAEGDDHVPVEVAATVEPGETTTNVRLIAARGASIAARVVDGRGQPVEGAEVVVAEREQGAPTSGMRFHSRRVERRSTDGHENVIIDGGGPRVLARGKTNDDGQVRLGGLPIGGVDVHASHRSWAPSSVISLTLAAGGTTTTELTLRQGGRLQLTAVDADQNPLPDAGFLLQGPSDGAAAPDPTSAKTDAAGNADLGPLAAGSYTAVLEAPEHPRKIGGGTFISLAGGQALEPSRVSFTIVAGNTARVTLVQPVMTTLEGILRDAGGAVAGGTVEALPVEDGSVPAFGGPSATTDRDGRFVIEGLVAGKYTLRYGRAGQAIAAEESLELAGERRVRKDLELVAGAVRVQVISADGSSLARAKVTLRRMAGDGEPARPRMIAMIRTSESGGGEQSMQIGNKRASTETGDDGVATIIDLPPGKYTLSIEHPSHTRQTVDDVEVAAKTTNDLGQVTLAPGGSIQGTVVDAAGVAPSFAMVELQPRDGPPRSPAGSMRGSFRFTGLAPGVYSLRARGVGPGPSRPWGPRREVTVVAGGTVRAELQLGQ